MKTITINENEIPVYCTVAEADQYFSEKFGGESWASQTEADKKKGYCYSYKETEPADL